MMISDSSLFKTRNWVTCVSGAFPEGVNSVAGFVGVKIFAHASTNKHVLSLGSYTFSLSMGKPVNRLCQLFLHHGIFWGWERVRTIIKYQLLISLLLSFASSLKINILTVLLIELCTLRHMYIFYLEKLPPPFQGLAEISCHNPSSSTAILSLNLYMYICTFED